MGRARRLQSDIRPLRRLPTTGDDSMNARAASPPPLLPPSPLTLAAQPAGGTQPVTHEALWMMKRVGAPALSPDGKWVAVSVAEPSYDEKKEVSALWIVPADGSAPPRRLTSSKAAEGGADWSPDSRRLAFTARREDDDVAQVYVLDVAGGGGGGGGGGG